MASGWRKGAWFSRFSVIQSDSKTRPLKCIVDQAPISADGAVFQMEDDDDDALIPTGEDTVRMWLHDEELHEKSAILFNQAKHQKLHSNVCNT